MTNAYKFIAFGSLSVIFAYIGLRLESQFANKFAENILSLLTTLFAINIATTTLIAGKLRDIQAESGFKFPQSKKELKASFLQQIILIAVVFVCGILRESQYLLSHFNTDVFIIICNSIQYFVFIFYLDIIWDIGNALFTLMDFDPGKEEK